MAIQDINGQWVCAYCGLKSPKGHWRPKTWIEKHEKNCPRHPSNNQVDDSKKLPIKMKTMEHFKKKIDGK